MNEDETKEKVNKIENNRENPVPTNNEPVENLDESANNNELNKPDTEGVKKNYASEAIPKKMNNHEAFRKTLNNKNYYKDEAEKLKQRKEIADSERKSKTKEVPKTEDKTDNNTEKNNDNIDKKEETEIKDKNKLDKAKDIKNSAASRMGMLNNKLNNAKSKAYAAEHPVDAGKEILEAKFKKTLLLLMKNPMFWLIILIIIFLLFLFFLVIFLTGEANADYDGTSSSYSDLCSSISMTETSLSKTEFINAVENYYKNHNPRNQQFVSKAAEIYDMGKKNNVNPELVYERAEVEQTGNSSNNNYWGIAVYNGQNSGSTFSTFMDGVLGYMKNVSQYSTLDAMTSKYAYIGKYWYNKYDGNGNINWGLGGCAYYDYLAKYLSSSRASQVSSACSKNSCSNSGSGCLATTAEDQEAYSKYNQELMLNYRKLIFGLGEDECDEANYNTTCMVFNQWDSKWGSIPLGSSSSTIGSAGCAVTSLAMGISCYAKNITISNFNPGTFVQKLNAGNCFTSSGEINWSCSAINEVAPSIKLHAAIVYVGNLNNSEKVKKVQSYDPNKYFVLLHVTHHYILYESVNSDGNFVTLDPNGGIKDKVYTPTTVADLDVYEYN
jgi:chemotaxis protein histidine kinase CheA